MIFVSTGNEISKAGVLLVAKSPHMFSFLRPPLERLGCECHVARSCQEISDLFSRTELHIVLGLNAYQNLSEIVSLLAGQCVSMFQVLRVEKGCWWLPVIRNGQDCLGTSAFSSKDFTYTLAEIVMGTHINITSRPRCAIPVTQIQVMRKWRNL
jgi:hypothetical protein